LKPNGPYTIEVKIFALNLNFESPAAYVWLRDVLPKGVLPHPMTLRNWYKGIDGSAGFTVESLRAINLQIASDSSKRLVLALAVDEMAIKRHVAWDKHAGKFIGHVSFGKSLDDLATKVIVFLATAINGSWKIPVGYFFTNGLDHLKRAKLLEGCLFFMKDIEAEIGSVTFDGDPANLKMVEAMGNWFMFFNPLNRP
jgi:Transposase protein